MGSAQTRMRRSRWRWRSSARCRRARGLPSYRCLERGGLVSKLGSPRRLSLHDRVTALTERVGNVDLVEVAAHDAQGGRRDESQVELGEEAGFILGDIEGWWL